MLQLCTSEPVQTLGMLNALGVDAKWWKQWHKGLNVFLFFPWTCSFFDLPLANVCCFQGSRQSPHDWLNSKLRHNGLKFILFILQGNDKWLQVMDILTSLNFATCGVLPVAERENLVETGHSTSSPGTEGGTHQRWQWWPRWTAPSSCLSPPRGPGSSS